MRATVPGSAANLGPGFDTLALAIDLHVEVSISPAESLTITSSGEGADLPCDGDHLAAQVARDVIGHDRLAITVDSHIPVARGLGSSAALAVAAAAAAGAEDPLEVATRFDGHAENAAASIMGGLVTVSMTGGVPVATPLFLDPDLTFVVAVPDRTLSTEVARQALPAEVSLDDAAFNLGRLGWLIAGLGDSSCLRPEVMQDRLHQTQRTPLFPESAAIMDDLIAGGAKTACWSGAGPSLLALCVGRDKAEKTRQAGEESMARHGVEGSVRVLASDGGGLRIS